VLESRSRVFLTFSEKLRGLLVVCDQLLEVRAVAGQVHFALTVFRALFLQLLPRIDK